MFILLLKLHGEMSCICFMDLVQKIHIWLIRQGSYKNCSKVWLSLTHIFFNAFCCLLRILCNIISNNTLHIIFCVNYWFLILSVDVEHSHVRFLGNLVLNLWDCGGQEAFMENYFASQRDNIFRNVEVLIYVFDVESREMEKDMHYYQSCLEAILQVCL